jgi:hypothetical protein
MKIMLDGPYGTHKINLDSDEYEVFLLISGGIGITPIQSVYNHLITQVSQEGRAMKKVLFIWSVRDRVLIDTMSPDILESNKQAVQSTTNPPSPSSSSFSPADVTPLSFQPPMHAIAPELFQDSKLNTTTERDSLPSSSTKQSSTPSQDIYDNKIFHNQFYLTKSRQQAAYADAGIDPDHQPWLHFGRPDLSEIFKETAKMVVSSRNSLLRKPRVAVCVCGPQSMVNSVQDLCRTTSVADGSQIVFDCHAEVFDF